MTTPNTNAELVRAIRDSLPNAMEWTERDQLLLGLPEAQARDLDALEGRLDDLPALREARNQRIALGRLVGLVDVPHEASTASLRASKAAKARWRKAG